MNTNTDRTILRRLLQDEIGVTIVEELVSIAIIGMGIVILVAMITTGVLGVQVIDDAVRSENMARSQLELIKDAPYQADPISSPYPAVGVLPGYAVGISIEYWNASTSSFQSGLRNDGLQRITVIVSAGGSPIKSITGFKVDR